MTAYAGIFATQLDPLTFLLVVSGLSILGVVFAELYQRWA